MTTISIEHNLARDLIETKIQVLNAEIEIMLESWNYTSAELFISDTRKGEIPEAESDAIALTNLLDRKTELERILHAIDGKLYREAESELVKEAIKRVVKEDAFLLERLAE